MAPFNKVIGSHQFAYLSNRRMDHGICLLASAIQRSALNPDSKTGFLSVDFKGAFDSVHHNFLRKVLSAFGLGPNACNLLLALASNLKGTVITNDLLSAFFDIEKGLPQGSSLSALLFIISLEPLLRSSSRLSTSCDGVDFGIHLSAIIRYICFADDLTIPFNSLSQLDGWLLCLKRFSSFSGLCVNWEKSVIYLLGGSFWTSSPSGIITPSTSGQIFANAITSSFPLLPPSCIKIAGDFKYCGITFSITDLMGKDRSLTASCWATRIKAMGARASILKHKIHLLSFQHRANVALSRCLSTILFLAQTSVCPEKYLREAQQHMNYLVYKCRAPPALLRIVSLPPNHGGLGHVNVKLRFRAAAGMWIPQYINEMLSPCLDAIFSDGLIESLHQLNVPVLLINDCYKTRTSLIEAVITASGAYAARHSASSSSLCNVMFRHQHSPASLMPIFTHALRAFGNSGTCRSFISPGDDHHIDQLLADALDEPLHLNSMIDISSTDSAIPCGTRLHPRSMVLRFKGWWKLKHVIALDGTCSPWSVVTANYLASRCQNQWRVGFLPGSSSDNLLPRPGNNLACNAAWTQHTPKALQTLLATHALSSTRPLQIKKYGPALPIHLAITRRSSRPTLFPLCLPVYSPLVSSPRPEDVRMIPASAISTKDLYNSLVADSFRELHDVLASTPVIFQDNKGWHKSLQCTLNPFKHWRLLLLSVNRRGIPHFIRFSVLSVFFNILICRPAKAFGVDTFSASSNWSKCPLCNGELSPPHYLYICPGTSDFWVHILRILHAMVPTLSLPAPNILTAAHFCTAGLAFLHYDSWNSRDADTLISVFGHAYNAISTTRKKLLSTTSPTTLCTNLFNTFVLSFEKQIMRAVTTSNPHGNVTNPRLSITAAKAVAVPPALMVFDGHSFLTTYREGTAVSSHHKSVAPPCNAMASSAVDTFYPFAFFRTDVSVDSPMVQTRMPCLLWPRSGPSTDGSWLPFIQFSAGRRAPMIVPLPAPPLPHLPVILSTPPTLVPNLPGTAHLPPCFEHLPIGVLPPDCSLFHAATDGAALYNGSIYSRAACAAIFPSARHRDCSELVPWYLPATNNAGEILGVTRALLVARDEAPNKVCVIYTDSTTVMLGILRHAVRWRANPPLSSSLPMRSTFGRPGLGKENPALIPLYHGLGKALQGRITIFRHVAAHSGRTDFASVYNDLADKAATAALNEAGIG